MNLSPDGGVTPAPRTARRPRGDATPPTQSGMGFDGDIDIPIIDWRHYLEDELDMHHSHQSFATRQRMLDADGDAGNQVIWFTDARPAVGVRPDADGVRGDRRVDGEHRGPPRTRRSPRTGRRAPSTRCFDTDGNVIAAGDDVWDGVLDDEPRRRLHAAVPDLLVVAPRMAGGPFEGGVFKCQLQPVDRRHRRRRLRLVGARPAERGPARADLPDRRVRLDATRRRAPNRGYFPVEGAEPRLRYASDDARPARSMSCSRCSFSGR